MRKSILIFGLLLSFIALSAQEANIARYKQDNDIAYVKENEADEYKKDRCKLDIYYPENCKNYPTIVWFHGGGLESGSKFIPNELKKQRSCNSSC